MRRIAAEARTFHLRSLTEDVTLDQESGGDALVLLSRWGTDRVDRPSPRVREVLRRMALGPVLLTGTPEPADGEPVVPRVLGRLSHLVIHTLGVDDLRGPLLSALPVARHAAFPRVRLSERQPVRAAGPLLLTTRGSGWVLKHAGSPYRVIVHRSEAALVASLLAWPVTPGAASAALRLPPRVTAAVIGHLVAAGIAEPVGRPAD
ncbi:NADH oxidase [Streptomyces sp. RFCAC02]|uniref:NADH oxidase n=1 Tax=Streptomyces sp. RFCAC02 TaxID=2499143 RepID=UPI00101F8A26|nr:NADH oxidase [Streptomyces sp. RFCAC02]